MKNLPDKIYLDIRGFENVDMSFSEVRRRFGIPYYEHSMSNNDIEYVCKDAFIEKACDWIRKAGNDWYLSEFGEDIIDFVKLEKDFKKYMEDWL